MKKLGKKIHNHQGTIEAYANCTGNCTCNYSSCGGGTTQMVSLMTNVSNLVKNF